MGEIRGHQIVLRWHLTLLSVFVRGPDSGRRFASWSLHRVKLLFDGKGFSCGSSLTPIPGTDSVL